MPERLILDKAGRVVIPKTLRQELQLQPGDTLEMQTAGDQITLRPLRGTAPLQKEDGIWVFRTGKRLPSFVTDHVLNDLRSSRDTQHSKRSK